MRAGGPHDRTRVGFARMTTSRRNSVESGDGGLPPSRYVLRPPLTPMTCPVM
jgi:hypothetical protein